jgi:hypothetical protein
MVATNRHVIELLVSSVEGLLESVLHVHLCKKTGVSVVVLLSALLLCQICYLNTNVVTVIAFFYIIHRPVFI